jgi:HK97 family phage portal protein
MGLIRSLLTPEKRIMSLADLDAAMDRAVNGAQSWTGRAVGVNESLSVGAVYACITLLADMVASLPLMTYRRLPAAQGGGKARAFSEPLYRILHDRPNPEMTSYQMRETIMGHLLLRGNAYLNVVRNGYGVTELWPLNPDRMALWRDNAGTLYYVYRARNPDGTHEDRRLWPSEVCHIPGLSPDGLVGYSPLELMRQSVASNLGVQEYGARFFGQNGRPDGIVTYKGRLDDAGIKRLKAEWEALHSGLTNAHRVAVLEDGTSWQALGIAPEHAQFLETRRFEKGEIATWFRVPPHLISDVSGSTSWGTGIEQQALGFVKFTLAPTWLARIESQFNADLFTADEQSYLYCEFLLDAMLRGDIKSRYDSYAVGRQNGWLNGDEIRALENMNAMPNEIGKVFWMPANYNDASKPKPEPVPPAPPAAPVAEPADDTAIDEKPQDNKTNGTARAAVEAYR